MKFVIDPYGDGLRLTFNACHRVEGRIAGRVVDAPDDGQWEICDIAGFEFIHERPH